MYTQEELESILRRDHAYGLQIDGAEEYQVDVPDWLFEEIAQIFFECGGITTELPEELIQRAADAGVAVSAKFASKGIYEVVLHKKFELTDPAHFILSLEEVGMQDLGIQTLGDLVDFLVTPPGILPYIGNDGGDQLQFLYRSLQAQGFMD